MLCGALLCAGPAAAQALSPMTETVVTGADRAALRVTVRNPGLRRMRLVLSAYEADWSPLPGAEATRGTLDLAASAEAAILVTVPMNGASRRDFRVCVTSMPDETGVGSQVVRGQVCGRYAAWRHRP